MGEDFNQLSGEDITALGFMAHGGHGCISVTSNVAPRLCAEFQAACLKGDFKTALKLQDKLTPLHINLFVETSPAPVKYAMSLIGKCADTVRLPMVPASESASRRARGHGACRADQLAGGRQLSRLAPAGRNAAAAPTGLAAVAPAWRLRSGRPAELAALGEAVRFTARRFPAGTFALAAARLHGGKRESCESGRDD